MAEALVGGAFLSAFLKVLFDRLASRKIIDYFKREKLDDGLLQKLKNTLMAVKVFLEDAEDKILKSDVRDWLDELKDAVYKADDLLDEIAYEAHRSELEATPQRQCCPQKDEVLKFISSINPFKKRLQLEEKMDKILKTFDDLVKLTSRLGLKECIAENPALRTQPTSSVVVESDVLGRHKEKEDIMDMVLSNGSGIGVVAVVGMGGIGKTTLAQFVYNDDRVQGFDINAWVYVSEPLEVSKITRDILQEIRKGDGQISPASNFNQLQNELKEKMMGQRFLLVLDDVWNVNHDDWETLLRPLRSGKEGSRILVTTRNVNLASVVKMETFSSYPLNGLMNNDTWLLFARHAFGSNDENSSEYPQLEEIGREIVTKCQGLPLALKALGNMCGERRNIREWDKILNSEVLNSEMFSQSRPTILPALLLSYQYLPSHLKQCFAYCSLFPKGYQFKKDAIVLLWMAEGFLKKPEMEVGRTYFDILVSKSFFQVSTMQDSCFVMHDLVNDLAKFVSSKFCFLLEGGDSSSMQENIRYFSFENCSSLEQLDHIYIARSLRTFLFLGWPPYIFQDFKCDEAAMTEALKKLEYLRVLSFPLAFHKSEVLPDVICDLKHLRYLDLSDALELKKLPETLGNLYNLETLILFGCRKLEKLPTTFGRLINMVYLDIRSTNLQEMPPGMGKLENLQILADFYVSGENGGSRIKELDKLLHIEGSLKICNLRNVENFEDAKEANLKGKNKLQELSLIWEGDCDDDDEICEKEKAVLEQLQPQERIEKLLIKGYGGITFPSWVGLSSFSNLLELELQDCHCCVQLPPLGQLASLKRLVICGFSSIEVVGSEFYGDNLSPFRSLEYLEFKEMGERWEWKENEGGAFPLLQELRIQDCHCLTNLALPNHLPSVQELRIQDCHCLTNLALPNHLPSLEEIHIQGCHCLTNFDRPNRLPSLKLGLIHDCPNMPVVQMSAYSFPDIRIADSDSSLYSMDLEIVASSPSEIIQLDLTSRRSLSIRDCPNIIYFLNGGFHAPNLKHLHIANCSHLKSLSESMHSSLPSLVTLEIRYCPELESASEEQLPCGLESLFIDSCNKLLGSCRHWESQNLMSFHITVNEDLENFPQEIVLPSNVTSLEIMNLQKLVYFEGKGIQHLTSLQKLRISNCSNLVSFGEEGLHSRNLREPVLYDCPKLRSFPEGGMPLGLQSLEIHKCDKLISNRMQWHLQKLSSLSTLSIGDYHHLESFPEEALLPSTLTCLRINELKNLTSLKGKELQQLNSLKIFKIWNCPKLESIPVDELPSSLSELDILYCPKLPPMQWHLLKRRFKINVFNN